MSVGSNSFRLKPKRALAIVMIVVMGIATMGLGATIAVTGGDPELWLVFGIFVLGTPALALLKLSPSSFVDIGDEGFVVSVPTVWGARTSEYKWSDCGELSAIKKMIGSTIHFNHPPTAGTKTAALNRVALGSDAAFDYHFARPIEETVAEMNRRRALVVGFNRPRQ